MGSNDFIRNCDLFINVVQKRRDGWEAGNDARDSVCQQRGPSNEAAGDAVTFSTIRSIYILQDMVAETGPYYWHHYGAIREYHPHIVK